MLRRHYTWHSLTDPCMATTARRLMADVRRLGGRAATRQDQPELSADFTHLLLPERDGFKTVIKVLLAMAAGKPVVSPAWLAASVRAGGWLWLAALLMALLHVVRCCGQCAAARGALLWAVPFRCRPVVGHVFLAVRVV
jgi:hypothetical protein